MSGGKTVLVTGATAGIGRAAALRLARAGHRVFGTGRRQGALDELEREAKSEGLALETLRLDVTSPSSIRSAAQAIHERTNGRGLDVLVNNAGYALAGPLEVLEPEALRAQFDTNVHGLLAVTQAFVPAMRTRRSGLVINISSVGGRFTMPLAGAYHATKYAVEALSDALRMELSPFGVRVSVIEPGMVRSEFTDRLIEALPASVETSVYGEVATAALERMKSVDRFASPPAPVAEAVLRAVSARRPRARYVAPRFYRLGLLFMALLPTRWRDALMVRAFGLHRLASESVRLAQLGGEA